MDEAEIRRLHTEYLKVPTAFWLDWTVEAVKELDRQRSQAILWTNATTAGTPFWMLQNCYAQNAHPLHQASTGLLNQAGMLGAIGLQGLFR